MRECPNYDLSLLADRFTEYGDYTREVILDELQYWRDKTDFLVLIHGRSFLIGYRYRNSLWIAQLYHDELNFKVAEEALEYAKRWAKERSLKAIKGETTRRQFKAMSRYGWQECGVQMEIRLEDEDG